jgi:PhoH-like ATPase
MRKIFILDTSTLICDPAAYKHFTNSDVVIPIAVLNELDNLKKQPGEAGKHARVAIRLLDEIADKGDISTGILLDNDIMLKIDATYYDPNSSVYSGFGDPSYGDTQILICAYANWFTPYLSDESNKDVILVSNDINLRVKAKSRGLDAVSHERDGFSIS